MSVCELNKRITKSMEEYQKYKKSDQSLIYLENGSEKSITSFSINLTVGEKYYDYKRKQFIFIPSEGIKLKDGESILIETKERIILPYNIFGIVTGVGKNIFSNGFVSTGRIHPGYDGKLRIAYYHGVESTNKLIKEGMIIAGCVFLTTEMTLQEKYKSSLEDTNPITDYLTRKDIIVSWIRNNWYGILSIIISLIAIIITISK